MASLSLVGWPALASGREMLEKRIGSDSCLPGLCCPQCRLSTWTASNDAPSQAQVWEEMRREQLGLCRS